MSIVTYRQRLLVIVGCMSWFAASILTSQPVAAQKEDITNATDAASLDQAKILISQDHFEAARPILLKLVKKYPRSNFVWKHLALCNLYNFQTMPADNEITSSAKACAEKASALDSEDGTSYKLLAEIEDEAGNFQRAIFYAGKGLTCKRPNVFCYRARSVAYSGLHKHAEALSDYTKFVASSPERSAERKLLSTKAQLLSEAGQDQEALVIYDKLQKARYTDDIPPIQAKILVKLKKPDEAIAILTNACKRAPADEMAYVQRARIYESLGNLQDALKDYSSAITIDGHADYLLSRAKIYDKLKQPAKAAADRKSAGDFY